MITPKKLIWSEKYRPETLDDCIITDDLRSLLESYVDEKFIPNILLSGPPGTGKTTIARVLCKEINAAYHEIPCSLEGGIATLRTEIHSFVTSMGLTSLGGRKYVILDEADHLTDATQAALRNYTQSYFEQAGFIMTANYPHRIIEPLRTSRFTEIAVAPPFMTIAKLGPQIEKRLCNILDQEGVKYDRKIIRELVAQNYPDMRSMLQRLQTFTKKNSVVNEGVLSHDFLIDLDDLFSYMKNKNWNKIREWVAENSTSLNFVQFITQLYDQSNHYIDETTIPEMIIILAEYQYNFPRAMNQEIHIAGMLTTMMKELSFK